MRITRTDDPAKGTKPSGERLEDLTLKALQWELTKLTGHDTVEKNRAVLIRRIRKLRRQKLADARAKAEAETPTSTMPQSLDGMSIEDLQRELNALTTRRTLERDRAVLIRMITKLRQKKQDKLEVKAEAEIEAEAGTPTVTQRLVAIANMKLPELREEYERVFGKPTLSRNRKALLVRIAEKLQADDAAAAETPTAPVAKPTLTVKFERKRGKKAGGKAKGRAKAKAAAGKETAAARRTTRPAGQRDPRLPKPGTTIQRVYKGKKLLVRVLDDGFEYDGKPYRSLSALAKHVTGSIVNGFVWWGLGLPSKEKKSS